jgi:PAS domain S-box-containing protein
MAECWWGKKPVVSETNLSISNERLAQALLETSTAVVVVFDGAGRLVRFNQAAQQLFGYQADEVVGRLFYEVFLPLDDAIRVKGGFARRASNNTMPSHFENLWLAKDGTPHTMFWTTSVVTENDALFVIAVGLDRSREYRAERERTALLELWRALDGLLPEIGTFEPEAFIAAAFAVLAKFIEVDALVLWEVNEHWYIKATLLHGQLPAAVWDAMTHGRMVGPNERAKYTSDGFIYIDEIPSHIRWHQLGLRSSANLILYPHEIHALPLGLAAYRLHTRAWSSSERALLEVAAHSIRMSLGRRQAEERFQVAFSQSFTHKVLYTPDERVVDANDVALAGIGLTRADLPSLVGKPISQTPWWQALADYADELRGYWAQACAGERVSFEVKTALAGQPYYGLATYTPIVDHTGRAILILVESHDVTAYRQTEQALQRANAVKRQFLSNMSHELRTPLNAILGFTELLREQFFGPLNPQQAEYIREIHHAGAHMLELVNDVLDVSQIESGQMKLDLAPTNLLAIASAVINLMHERARKAGLQLQLHTPIMPENPVLLVDGRKVKQILLNLISNAIKFTPSGGRVDLSVSQNQQHFEFCVADTGIGISPEHLERLFEHFTQLDESLSRKHEGLGLGLSLAKTYATLHGGNLTAESRLGIGSSFCLRLPNSNQEITLASALLFKNNH